MSPSRIPKRKDPCTKSNAPSPNLQKAAQLAHVSEKETKGSYVGHLSPIGEKTRTITVPPTRGKSIAVTTSRGERGLFRGIPHYKVKTPKRKGNSPPHPPQKTGSPARNTRKKKEERRQAAV